MAKSKKPGIRNASRKTRKPRAVPMLGEPSVLEGLSTRVDTVERACRKLAEEHAAKPPALVLDNLVADQLKSIVGSLRGIEEAVVKAVELLAHPVVKERKPREAKPEAAPAEEKPAGGAIQGPDAKCACGKSFVGSMGHGRTKCEAVPATEKPAEKANGSAMTAPPTFEAFREVAVAFAQKHSKAKMLEVLKDYVPEGAELKLSLVPDARRAAAMKALAV